MAHVNASPVHNTASRSLNPLKWLLRLDYAYRQARKLRATEDHYLRDMGISGREANADFYTQYKEKRWLS